MRDTTQGGGPGWHHYQVLGLLSLSGGYSPPAIDIHKRAFRAAVLDVETGARGAPLGDVAVAVAGGAGAG